MRTVLLVVLLCAPSRAMEVRTDARIDLVGLLQRMAGQRSESSAYVDGALAHFSGFKDHPAVAMLREMGKTGFTGDLPSQYALYISTAGDFSETTPVPDLFVDAAGGRPRLDDFRLALADFVRRSGFKAWHRTQALNGLLARKFATAASAGVEVPLLNYLGTPSWRRLIAVPSAFFPPGATSEWVLEDDGKLPVVFVIIGPEWRGGEPSYGGPEAAAQAVWPEAVYSTMYVVHELCRPALPSPPREACTRAKTMNQDSRETCLMDYWTQAAVRRLQLKTFGRPSPRKTDAYDTPWARELDAVLEDYEKNRDKYQSLADFSPNLARPFSEGGKAAACRFEDPSRMGEALYKKRLGYWREMHWWRKK